MTTDHCDGCGAIGRELERHVVKAEPCPHCLRGENVAHRSMVVSEEFICRECFGEILDRRRAELKAQAGQGAPPAVLTPLEGKDVPF